MRNPWRTYQRNNKQIQNFSIYGFGQMINLLAPLLVAPYVIAVCGEAGFGKAGIGLSFAFILTVLVDFASGINGTKEVSVHRDNPQKIQEIALQLFGLKALMLLVILAMTTVVIFSFSVFESEKKLLFFSLSILIAQAINPIWFLQGIEHFKAISVINILSKCLYILLVFVFIAIPEDYVLVNLFFGIGGFVANLIGLLWLLQRKVIVFRRPKALEMAQLFKRDASLTFSQLLLSLQQYAPVILVGYFGGNIMAGQYKIIEQIIMVFRTYLQVIFNFIFTRICYLMAKNKKSGLKQWFLFNVLNFIVVLAGLLLIFIFSLEILLFFNASQPEALVFYLRLALVIPLLYALNIPLQQLILAFNHQKKYVFFTILMAFLMMFCTIIGFNYGGLLILFSIMISTEILLVLLYLYTLKKDLR